jgi:hypothetical protein
VTSEEILLYNGFVVVLPSFFSFCFLERSYSYGHLYGGHWNLAGIVFFFASGNSLEQNSLLLLLEANKSEAQGQKKTTPEDNAAGSIELVDSVQTLPGVVPKLGM